MNSKDLMEAIGEMNEKYIELYADVKAKKKPAMLKWIVPVAACLVLAAVAIPLLTQIGKSPVNDPPVIPADPSVYENDFVIEGGVLLRYNGTVGNVVIPDEVVSVADGAFANAGSVTSLTLGKNTAEIGSAVFASLPALESVSVPEGNTSFLSTGHVLVSRDGGLAFASVGAWKEDQFDYVVVEVVKEMKRDGVAAENMKELVIGPATVSLTARTVDETVYPAASAICVYGQTVTFAEPIPLVLNGKFQAFEANDFFVISSATYGVGESYILTKDGQCVTVESPIPAKNGEFWNDTIISFFEKNGELCLAKQPRKYFIHQVSGGYMQYCTSADEIFEEEGTASVEKGTVVYLPITFTTVEDAIDMEQEFADWKATCGLADDLTLEEYLKRNAAAQEGQN